jgi:hypothetical protein
MPVLSAAGWRRSHGYQTDATATSSAALGMGPGDPAEDRAHLAPVLAAGLEGSGPLREELSSEGVAGHSSAPQDHGT